MKNLILLAALAVLFTQVQAQTCKAKDVPTAVSTAFYKAYPTVSDVDWNKDGNNYEAEYDANKVEMLATYTPSGKLVETEMGIVSEALPAPVMTYMKTNYKEDEVSEASKITGADGTVYYEVEEKGTDLVFDSKGGFIRSEKDSD